MCRRASGDNHAVVLSSITQGSLGGLSCHTCIHVHVYMYNIYTVVVHIYAIVITMS